FGEIQRYFDLSAGFLIDPEILLQPFDERFFSVLLNMILVLSFAELIVHHWIPFSGLCVSDSGLHFQKLFGVRKTPGMADDMQHSVFHLPYSTIQRTGTPYSDLNTGLLMDSRIKTCKERRIVLLQDCTFLSVSAV
ncbi:MAG: hypothetical protein IJ174_05475, partial [Clostridia bacterium]|nr:hypothetical protein [Clostridia bacterium]